ncbi:helix-turn-helix transcriptional regulator [Paenarthrobacter sp. NPDC056912]|uniref:helix-turn-helix transcriptional regulator n=1 Tax=Paenarthrobacter sp. NPDC056912 TaxID=3345965 RepID=UPI003671E207
MPSESFMATLSAEVRARRTSLSLSQQDLSDLAGVSERFVRFVEKGKATVQLEPLLKVLATLGLELTVRAAGGATPPVATK